MFVKKLVEKASKKQHTGAVSGLRAEDVSPRLAFHYGVPADAALLSYDPILHILAVSTRNGQIKLFGRDNTQALLQSPSPTPSKFLRFADGQGVLLNVSTKNQIEVWDIDTRKLCYLHPFEKEITAISVLPQSFYIYVGDSVGNVSLLKLDLGQRCLIDMPYWIPFAESYGSTANVGDSVEVAFVSPQPLAEHNRVLIIFRDGVIILWDIKASKSIFVSGKTIQHQSHQEDKNVTSACWACNKGSKIAVGYDSGDIYLWAIPDILSAQNSLSTGTQNLPLQRLNLGYKLDKLPIVSLRWVSSDAKSGRLYINGFSNQGYLFQVLILNEESESRIVKMVLPLTEACEGMELVTGLSDPNKHRQNTLVLLLKSGQICLYDDSDIERYLLHSQSRSPPTLPNYLPVKQPYGDSGINVAKFLTSSPTALSSSDEDYFSSLCTKYPWLFSLKDKGQISTSFTNINKTRNFYITGHLDGTINFWDASCPLLLQVFMIKQQNEDNISSGAPITALQFDMSSSILLAGDQSGMVRIITFKKDSSDNIFSFLHGKQGDNYSVRSIKLKGAVTSTSVISQSKNYAIGTEKGIVSVINIEDGTIVYQKQLECRVSGGIASLQFELYSNKGYDKDLLIVGMEDSSIFILEEETGKLLNANPVQTDKPSKPLLMQTFELLPDDTSVSHNSDIVSKESLLLLCTENAIRLFSLSHAIQGVKKVINKKKFNGTCCFASLIHSTSEIGLVLVFSNGKVEIRSLPDLSLLKDASLRGFVYSRNLNSSTTITGSSDGEIILVNRDETYFFSALCQNDIYRHVDNINTVYRKDILPREESSYVVKSPKEKKKGLFGMIMKDAKGSKTKESDSNGSQQFIATTSEELSSIFSSANFIPPSERRNSSPKEDENIELDIDDIDIEENTQKQKGPHFPGLNKQKISKGLQTLRGKLKPKTEEKVNSVNKQPVEDETSRSQIDQIKMKYGYAANDDSTSVPKMIGNKLQENMKKLEGINLRSSDMANGAQSFSAMAKELLRTTKNEKGSS